MLEEAFSDFDDLRIVEEEREILEGTSHLGMSALIGLTGRKPKRQKHHRIRRLRMSNVVHSAAVHGQHLGGDPARLWRG
jgi:hypothetical protein